MGQTQTSERAHTAQLNSPMGGVIYTVDFDFAPFSRGTCRLAFRGVYRGKGPKNGDQCVTKIPSIRDRRCTAKDYAADIRASLKAQELATLFNKEFASSKPLTFVLPTLATVLMVGEANNLVNPGETILVEDFIEGNYEKFNNNANYQSDEVATVPCFSHFTYYKTGGRYLVCDIQGVRKPKGYILTDPAVHSKSDDGEFGDTDLGRQGMVRFFSSHRCTSVCGSFPISDLSKGKDLPEKSVASTRKTYCGRVLGNSDCDCCDGICGPRDGCNCADCMRQDIAEFELINKCALVNREGAISTLSRNRKFYCGRKNMIRDAMTDGFCGPDDGNNCHACRQLDIQARGRYYDIVKGWYSSKPLPVPSTVIVKK